jgi:glycosyltransferase involved in cell wall biosynthesis
MNILIVTSAPIPFGMALTNRIIGFAKGFIENGHNCEILVLHPTEKINNIKNHSTNSTFEGVNFHYNAISTLWPSNKINKIVIFIKSILSLKTFIKMKFINKKVDFILLFHTYSFFLFAVISIARKLNIKIIHERSEYPFIGINSLIKKIDYYIYTNLIIHKFNGFLFITNELSKFFLTKVKINKKFLIVPIVVEPGRFKCDKALSEIKYIAYCGYMWGDKDGILILVEAFSRIHNLFPELYLYLIGDISNKKEYKNLIDKLETLGIKNKVVFTGNINRNDMPGYLCSAKLLVLSRPNNIQAKAGFPTKLGEYLATGVPVLITKVGDIPNYIKDRVNGFLAEPSSVISFAEKINWIFNNYEFSKKVGLEGKKLAYSDFNNLYQAKRIVEFVEGIE